MNRLLALLPLFAISCGPAAGADEVSPIVQVGPEDEVSADVTLPTGAFASIDALCAQQMALVAPAMEERSHELLDRETPLAPSCVEDAPALRTTRVTLSGPFLALTAVTYETPDLTLTSLVVETHAGFFAVNPAVVEVARFDPGCASSLRDDGVGEVRVLDGRLVIIDSADRGWGDASDLFLERARTCTLHKESVACTEPVTIAVSLANETGKHELFRTTYAIGADGTIVPAHEWEAPEFAE